MMLDPIHRGSGASLPDRPRETFGRLFTTPGGARADRSGGGPCRRRPGHCRPRTSRGRPPAAVAPPPARWIHVNGVLVRSGKPITGWIDGPASRLRTIVSRAKDDGRRPAVNCSPPCRPARPRRRRFAPHRIHAASRSRRYRRPPARGPAPDNVLIWLRCGHRRRPPSDNPPIRTRRIPTNVVPFASHGGAGSRPTLIPRPRGERGPDAEEGPRTRGRSRRGSAAPRFEAPLRARPGRRERSLAIQWTQTWTTRDGQEGRVGPRGGARTRAAHSIRSKEQPSLRSCWPSCSAREPSPSVWLEATARAAHAAVRTEAALAAARDALIGYAASYPDQHAGRHGPGYLPCPDRNGNGSPNTPCPRKSLGRLPWRRLGLHDPRDGAGERLWYALADNFRPTATSTVRSTPARRRSWWWTAGGGIAAVLFAPGSPLSFQDRRTRPIRPCPVPGGRQRDGGRFHLRLAGTVAHPIRRIA